MAENQSGTASVLSPEEPALQAERAFMKAQSRLVNQFNPTDSDNETLDNAAKKVNELYATYPENKPIPTTKPTP